MRRILAAFVLTLTLLASGPAIPATPAFLPIAQRQGDPKVTVWVNTNSSVYHCPGTRWYGNTKQGKYMSQREAQAAGYRPAYGSVCG
jgi:hypothetical protein